MSKPSTVEDPKTPRSTGVSGSLQLDEIADLIPDAILCIDRAWRITYMNAEARRLTRDAPDSYPRGTFWDHYPEIQDLELGQMCRRTMESGQAQHTDLFYPPSGMWLDVRVLSTGDGIALYFRDVTAAKETQKAREAIELQFHQILETTTDCVCVLDRAWRFTYVNQHAEQVLGRKDLIGKEHWQEFPEATEETDWYRYYHAAMDHGIPGEFEAFYPQPHNFWLKVICRPTEQGIVLFFRDCTRERENRLNLARQHTLLSETQQVARVATWELDLETGALTHMPGSFPVLGRPLAAVNTVDAYKACVYPPHIQRIDDAVSLAMRTRDSVTMEFQIVAEDGTRAWLESRLQVVETAGKPSHLRGLTIDITGRKRADERREIAIRELDRVMHATSEGVITLDRAWRITYMNPQSQELVIPRGDYIGQNFWEAFPVLRGEASKPFRNAMELGRTLEFEAFYPSPYNAWFSTSVRPSEDGIIIFSRNISVEKQAQLQVQQQQQLIAAIQRDAAVATWVVDLKTDALIFQPDSFPVFGRPNEELDTVAKWRTFVIQPREDIVIQMVEDAIRSGEPVRHEWKMRAADGSAVWVQSRYSAVFENGVPVQLRGISVDNTAEQLARQQLAEERETLQHIQQTARVASWEHDLAAGRVRYTSGSYPIYGRPLEEITNRAAFLNLIHPDDRDRIARSIQAAQDTPHPTINEFRVIAPDGNVLWMEERFTAVREHGSNVRLRGMTFDITERKRAEEALRQSEERYRVLAELNPQAMWMASPEGEIIYANQNFLDYIGLTVAEYSRWLETFDPADRNSVSATWRQSMTTGANLDMEARLLRSSDGASRWWWLRSQPVRDVDGVILNWLGVGMDIHDRRTFADALQAKQEETERQRQELEAVYATAPIGLALFDPVEFRYLRLNQRQAEFFGLEPKDIVGKTLIEMAPIPGLRELFEQVRDGKPVVNFTLEGEVANDPAHRYWTVNYFPVYDANGTVRAISAASLEITPQKRAENALIQSEKLAAVGRLATSISHEINNPLEAITNLLYLISSARELSDETRLYLSMAQSELGRVCQIATQTLRFHRQAVGPTLVAGEDMVSAVLNLYQGRLSNSGIRVETKYTSARKILCFENDIRQVLNNLIANAIDAMRTGGRLVVRTHDSVAYYPSKSEATEGIRITIADTGHGMTPEVMRRIFEAFYTTKDLNGTGLGMWISEGIVKRHHGTLQVRSSVDPIEHGTIFTLFLPAQEKISHAD